MVEAVKRHILNMLHLSSRPNLTQPVPRAALLNAIRKLHVGRVAADGTVEIQEEARGPWDPTPSEPPSEMITFAEPGESDNQSEAQVRVRTACSSLLLSRVQFLLCVCGLKTSDPRQCET